MTRPKFIKAETDALIAVDRIESISPTAQGKYVVTMANGSTFTISQLQAGRILADDKLDYLTRDGNPKSSYSEIG